MIDILWLNLQPTDQHLDQHINAFQAFHHPTVPHSLEVNPLSFKVSVSKSDCPLTFRLSRDSYALSLPLEEKVNEIHKELDVPSGGHVVAIDRYPMTQFLEGAWRSASPPWSSYDFQADFENAGCACIVLSVPGKTPMLLDAVRFACDPQGVEGWTPEVIVFHKDAVLSVRLPFGDIRGIALKHYKDHALTPEADTLKWTLRFEKRSLPAVVLQSLLSQGEKTCFYANTGYRCRCASWSL